MDAIVSVAEAKETDIGNLKFIGSSAIQMDRKLVLDCRESVWCTVASDSDVFFSAMYA